MANTKNIYSDKPMFQEKLATTVRAKQVQNIKTNITFTQHGVYVKTTRIKFVNQD